jgi:hypothetical protein
MTCKKYTRIGQPGAIIAIGTNLRFISNPGTSINVPGDVYPTVLAADCVPPSYQGTFSYSFPGGKFAAILDQGIGEFSDSPGSCGACETFYDCLNGSCIARSNYNTPGIYNSLSACQASCTGSACNGECIPTADIAALQQAANNLRPRICPP